MLETNFRQISGSVSPPSRNVEVESLHLRCGVYTNPKIVARILDAVGWRASVPLFQKRLLEPAAGDGEFIIEATRRLIKACHKHRKIPNTKLLRDCILAFEIHPGEADKARQRLRRALHEFGVHPRTAVTLANSWIVTADFLLAKELCGKFTHAVGNPPYIRWSKIPAGLEAKYRKSLPREMVGGDIFVPFLDRALGSLIVGGRCGFLCSDRWRYMAFANAFRAKWLPRLDIASEDALAATDAFRKNVDTYPTILIATVRLLQIQAPVVHTKKTLIEYGYQIKVGPALGHTPAFVLDSHQNDVEPELLYPWLDGSDIAEGCVSWRGRQIIAMNNTDGSLVAMQQFPKLSKRLRRYKQSLLNRSIVRNGAPWFRPIDRIRASDWASPKLLIPEIAKIPRLAADYSGAIPSHGVYAIFAPNQKIDTLYEHLAGGGLAQALNGIAPKIKGNYVRCYKRFLAQIRLA